MRLWALLLTALAPAFGQAVYQFRFDQDRLAGAPDFSFLNQPLGPADLLFTRGDHFYRVGADLAPGTADDERVRLFGVNLAFGANFPAENDAVRIARRLRRLGVNLVRLHHMDTQPDRDPNNAGSILTADPYPTLNPVGVRRLRAFLDALRGEGIYINLNLHVGYQFRPAVDQVPPHASFPSQSKPLHIFHPRMVELQAEFTRAVIAALRLKDDPVLAMVEINNESSLLREWQTANLDRFLTGEYGAELGSQWNDFLRGKYITTEALRRAWGEDVPDGPEQLAAPWVLEKGAPSDGRFQLLADTAEPTLRVDVTSVGPRLILKNVGFSVTDGSQYVAEVEMRIEAPDGASRPIYWDVKQDINPWRTMSGRTVQVTSRWQRFRMAFHASFPMEGIGRFGLAIERLDVPLFVRGWSFRAAGRKGLSPGELLEEGGVTLVGEDEAAREERVNDYLLFLTARDRHYLGEMLRAVRESADERVPVAGTQMGYGGLLNLDSHQDLDYQDHHFYIDHYNFPNVAWDGRDWRMRDVGEAAAGDFQSMALARQAGRPYTVSEYNQPWPNTYAAPIAPLLAAFGAFQDWDSIMHFAYSHGRNWDDGVPNGFNINGDWTKFASIGQAAWMLRTGAIRTGRDPVEIPLSREMRLRAGREKRNGAIPAFLAAALGVDADTAFLHPVRLGKDSEEPIPDVALRRIDCPCTADTGELTYDPLRRLFLIHAPMAAGVFGFAGRAKVTAGVIDLELAETARGFASILLTPLDDRPIAESRRLLLTTPGFSLRSQPATTPPRPQELVLYPGTTDWWTLEREPGFPAKPSGNLNGGSGPTWMERVEGFLTLRTTAGRLTVYPLDGDGSRLAPLAAADVEPVAGGFRIHFQADGQTPAPWYELVEE